MKNYNWVWNFNRKDISVVSAVFSCFENTDKWIKFNNLTGILTEMLVDISGYEWRIQNKEPRFEHYHYEKGVR